MEPDWDKAGGFKSGPKSPVFNVSVKWFTHSWPMLEIPP
jgi:hypothetical protein